MSLGRKGVDADVGDGTGEELGIGLNEGAVTLIGEKECIAEAGRGEDAVAIDGVFPNMTEAGLGEDAEAKDGCRSFT